jgi:hypothetical protein
MQGPGVIGDDAAITGRETQRREGLCWSNEQRVERVLQDTLIELRRHHKTKNKALRKRWCGVIAASRWIAALNREATASSIAKCLMRYGISIA